MTTRFTLTALPIFWRESTSYSEHGGIPGAMDLSIGIAKDWGGVQVVLTEQLKSTLTAIYLEEENIGYLQDDNPLSEIYGPEFVDFISTAVPAGTHVCEIGSGGCYTLRKLRAAGYKVSGIDPSPLAAEAGRKYNIPIISDFFPPQEHRDLGSFGAYIHYDVLEHIDEPLNFLQKIYALLPAGGRSVFVVPDCTEHIANQDIAMCMHQHLNYFTVNSLWSLAEKAGFQVEVLRQSQSTGTIFCSLAKTSGSSFQSRETEDPLVVVEIESRRFFDGVHRTFRAKVNEIERMVKESERGIAFYPPLRAIPYITGLIHKYRNRLFFVDDNSKVHGKFICNTDIPILSRQQAIEAGVRSFIVCSRPFKEAMTNKLTGSHAGPELKISYLEDF